MGLLFEQQDEGYALAVWQAVESVVELCSKLGVHPDKSPHKAATRQKEWLATRILLQHLFPGDMPSLEYDDHGKPHLINSGMAISISHTGHTVGVLVSNRPSCGLDIEHLHPRIEKIARRFLSDEEAHVLEHRNLEALFVAWGAKEVLYKIYGKGNLVFREHLRVKPFQLAESGTVTASLHTGIITHFYPVSYFFMNELVITYALA